MDDDARPAPYLPATTVAGHIQTCLYQMQRLHKECMQPLHVVLIAQTTLRTQARAPVLLFSSDVALASTPLVDYDGLRCQLEWNFRATKQSWGLEDVMHVTPPGVTNAATLSLCMVNVADHLRADLHPRDLDSSVLDVQADGRGDQYVEETIHMLAEKPEPVL